MSPISRPRSSENVDFDAGVTHKQLQLVNPTFSCLVWHEQEPGARGSCRSGWGQSLGWSCFMSSHCCWAIQEAAMGANLGCQGSNAENPALNLGAKTLLDLLKGSWQTGRFIRFKGKRSLLHFPLISCLFPPSSSSLLFPGFVIPPRQWHLLSFFCLPFHLLSLALF